MSHRTQGGAGEYITAFADKHHPVIEFILQECPTRSSRRAKVLHAAFSSRFGAEVLEQA